MKTYLTEYLWNWKIFSGPDVMAASWDDAQLWCNTNQPGLKVVGELVEEIEMECH